MKLKQVLFAVIGLSCCSLAVLAQEATTTRPAELPTLSAPAQPASEATAQATNSLPAGTNAVATAPATATEKKEPLTTNTIVSTDAPASSDNVPLTLTPSDNRGPLTLDHELPAAVQFLAKMADLNIHFDPSIMFTNVVGPEGKAGPPMVSLRWDNVTAEDALQEVLDVHGLMLMVNKRTKIARVTRKPSVAPLVTAVVQLKHSNPTNMAEIVKASFSDPARSKVNIDNRTTQLVIMTTEREMEGITNLLTQLDVPSKQVLIEAKILETAKSPNSIRGIDWSGTLEGQKVSFGNGVTSGTTTTATPGDPTTTTLPSGRTITSSSGQSVRTALSTLVGAGGLSLDTARGLHPATAFLNADGVHAVLSFLSTDSDTEVVATPRAVTADNETARLEVTRAFPIFQITPGSAQTPAGAQVTYTNVGTLLKVTPRVSANDNIALKVIPEVSNIDSKDVQIVNGTRNEANVYAIRRIEANVVIPSGNTLVMGGLISDTKRKAYTKVPMLGDLPGVGLAFRRDQKSRVKQNMLIFLTPTIVRDQDFQPTESTFLKTTPTDTTEYEEGFMDTGKPKRWGKSKTSKP